MRKANITYIHRARRPHSQLYIRQRVEMGTTSSASSLCDGGWRGGGWKRHSRGDPHTRHVILIHLFVQQTLNVIITLNAAYSHLPQCACIISVYVFFAYVRSRASRDYSRGHRIAVDTAPPSSLEANRAFRAPTGCLTRKQQQQPHLLIANNIPQRQRTCCAHCIFVWHANPRALRIFVLSRAAHSCAHCSCVLAAS